jgi:glycogen synthase
MPAGGIGTYVFKISRLLAAAGETVHVLGQLWPGAPREREELCDGRLIIHRVPMGNRDSLNRNASISRERIHELAGLHASSFPPQSFSWQACHLIESLIIEEGIDVIEAQEYEAPLYYFQLRRALGLGPKKHPPCFVHLHSPTSILIQYNGGDSYHPYFLTAGRLEAHSIAAADGLLCPSRYLANQAEAHFGIPKGVIQVIPLPIGDDEVLERDRDTWEHGSICYVGRLERRKGVLEWIDAAVSMAPEYPEATFDFIGSNCLSTDRVSGEQLIASRIPKKLKSRFRFWGAQERSQLSPFLLQARMAVVPSRWENFPNTCVEAMCSGLPVISSPEGGMAEMIIDRRNGWLATSADPAGLAVALQRALDTNPDEMALMGQNAANDIHGICDNQAILKRHMEFRTHLVHQGAGRSLHIPANLPWHAKPLHTPSPGRYSVDDQNAGIAVVVSCFHKAYGLDTCLRSIGNQTQMPSRVIVLIDEWTEEQAVKSFCASQKEGWQLIQIENGNRLTAKNLGVTAVLESGTKPMGFVFLAAEDQLKEKFIELASSVFRHCREAGIVSSWVEDLKYEKVVNTTPYPSFPFQWLSNELASFSAVRTEALIEAGKFRTFSWPEYENWDLFNAVMAAGWIAVTLPAILGKELTTHKYGLGPHNSIPHGSMCKEILGRFPDVIARDSNELLLLSIASGTYLMNAELTAMRNRLALAEKHLLRPKAVLRKLLYKVESRLKQRFPLKLSRFIEDIKN